MGKYNAALVGVGGFGEAHLHIMEKLVGEGRINFRAVCEINYAGNREKIDNLTDQGVRSYNDYSKLLHNERDLDFVVIATPIHLHKKMAVTAMESGYHVLLEKPPAVTIQDLDAIIETAKKTGKRCAINFVHTAGEAFDALKKHLKEGRIGKVNGMVGVGLWKRLEHYYTRTPWAGKLLENNNYVLDGSINNALSHLLNNMLILSSIQEPNHVSAVTAELYHAQPIESEDTACVKIEMSNELSLYYYTTLCNLKNDTPYIRVEGEDGAVIWNYNNELCVERYGRGTARQFPQEDNMEKIYKNLLAVISGAENELFCSVENTRNFVLASNGAFESSGGIHSVPSEFIDVRNEANSKATYIKGIEEIVALASLQKTLFEQLGVAWAIRGKRFALDNYQSFGMFKNAGKTTHFG